MADPTNQQEVHNVHMQNKEVHHMQNKGGRQEPELGYEIVRCGPVGFAKHGSGAQDNKGEGNNRT